MWRPAERVSEFGVRPAKPLGSAIGHCAASDPIPGQGWYDDNHGEIGDICAWQNKKLGTYMVQLLWSNKAGACV